MGGRRRFSTWSLFFSTLKNRSLSTVSHISASVPCPFGRKFCLLSFRTTASSRSRDALSSTKPHQTGEDDVTYVKMCLSSLVTDTMRRFLRLESQKSYNGKTPGGWYPSHGRPRVKNGFGRRTLRLSLALLSVVGVIGWAGLSKEVGLLRPGLRARRCFGTKRYGDVPGARITWDGNTGNEDNRSFAWFLNLTINYHDATPGAKKLEMRDSKKNRFFVFSIFLYNPLVTEVFCNFSRNLASF